MTDFSVSHGGRNDVMKHVRRKHHQETENAAKSSLSLASFCTPQSSQSKVIEAETRWATFTAKHNIAFLVSDHATKLFHKMFPDSEIARKFSCGRTKTTSIVKDALAPHYLHKTISNMSNPFSVMMDESNDKTDKSCIILARVFDPELRDVRTRFVDMPVVNIGTACNLFEALKSSLTQKGMDFSKAVAFMSDTTNVMKGVRSGVQKLINDENPMLYDVGCICHLADLTVKAGMSILSLLTSISSSLMSFISSITVVSVSKFVDLWCSLFTNEPEVILKHCPTRWLSLLRCVDRYIKQLEGLKSYFRSSHEETSKTRSILNRLENPLLKPLLYFLSYIMTPMCKFNRLFQKSDENTTCELYTDMCRLTRLYASNVLTVESITAAGDDLSRLKFDLDHQLDDESLGIGTDTWGYLAELEAEHELKPFFSAVRKFYIASIKKMLAKFPFGDSLLKNLGVLQQEKTASYDVHTILSLAKRFPQIGLADAESLDQLREEFLDFKLSPTDLPSLVEYTTADLTKKPRAGKFCSEVDGISTLDGKRRFTTLCKLMYGLLSIPCSNADSERAFSMLRKIHTDQRPNLEQSTIVSLMSVKFNCDDCCHDSNFSSELLTQCKKATTVALSINRHS